ncbi:hypothetical protein MPSEU_000437600 [Mayamaea pseudoterrestris]|nr:hypothetical protein MPSEU_000437600 [Mayamaea pseudoterrestris]
MEKPLDCESMSHPIVRTRLVGRNLPFNQSKNVIQVIHNYGMKIIRLTIHDSFHVLLRLSALQTILLMVTLLTMNVLFFASLYLAVDRNYDPKGVCNLGVSGKPLEFHTAFAISVQTSVSGGYCFPIGSNALFEDCPALQSVFYFQIGFSLLTNAVWIALMIAALGDNSQRAVQVLFSEKAIVSVHGSQTRFQVRIFDVNAKHPVVNAHVRLYAMMKDKPGPRSLRLVQPDDELGGGMFLSLPQVISHHIDLYSILHPPKADNPLLENKNGLDMREADSSIGKRGEVSCPVCSENFGTHNQWVRHVKYMQIAESVGKTPRPGAHGKIRELELDLDRYKPTSNLEVLHSHFDQEISEVVCVVEGTDPLTSGAFCAMQSYQSSDIVWDHGSAFHPCISVDSDIYRVDIDRFHDITKKTSGGRQHQVSTRVHDSFFAVGGTF